MANEKFEPQGQITDVEIKLECLRLATEFGPEYDRKDPITKRKNILTGLNKFQAIIRKGPQEKKSNCRL